jgi:hypothetical protein
MNRARTFLLAALGLALPAGLALAVYLTSAGPLAATPEVLAVSPQIGVPATTSTSAEEPTTTSRREDRQDDRRDDDLPGKCKDPDHRLDPDCDPGRDDDEDDDSSGRGRSGSDDDSSGPGGGDDDSSGSGSDNSGSDDD